MDIVEFRSNKELENYIKNKSIKYLGAGREGKCFLFPNNEVIKLLYDKYYRDFITKFDNINIPSFLFAYGGIEIDNYIKAIILKYANGQKISIIDFSKIELLQLKNDLEVLKKDITILSEKGIKAEDVYSGNIIYGDNGFKLIDTQGYSFSDFSMLKEVNCMVIMREIYKTIFNNLDINTYINGEGKYKDLFFDIYFLSNPTVFIDSLQMNVAKDYGIYVRTLGDMKRVLHK